MNVINERDYNQDTEIAQYWQDLAEKALREILSRPNPRYEDYLAFTKYLLGHGTSTASLEYRIDINGNISVLNYLPIKFLNMQAIDHLIGTAGQNTMAIIMLEYNDIDCLEPELLIKRIYKLFQAIFAILEISIKYYLSNNDFQSDHSTIKECEPVIQKRIKDFSRIMRNNIEGIKDNIYYLLLSNKQESLADNGKYLFDGLVSFANSKIAFDRRDKLVGEITRPIYIKEDFDIINSEPLIFLKSFFIEFREFLYNLRKKKFNEDTIKEFTLAIIGFLINHIQNITDVRQKFLASTSAFQLTENLLSGLNEN